MKITPGKLAGMKAVSTGTGTIAAAAMDQRGSLKKALGKAAGGDATDAMLEEFKSIVTAALTPHASAILLDPQWGIEASKRRSDNAGLLLAYEESGYDNTRPGRLPDLLPHWSVRRLKEAGADCVKVLIYYTPYDAAAVNHEKHAFIERIGDECRTNDIPFFLEFVGYDHEGGDEKGPAFAQRKPDVVAGSMAEFTKDRYGVDVMKVEIPVNMKFVEGTRSFQGTRVCTKEEAIHSFRQAAAVAQKPFIYLSAGVSNAEFTESLELATESGVEFAGVLCGRATWKEGIPVYATQGGDAFRAWLDTEGVRNIGNVNDALRGATSWFGAYGVESVEPQPA
ncbi:MAG: tagatose 1,6-diphosphate aldolase [Acidobacteria bacterium]|nr:tagatose 1,6-diphosphate aldolase [Acidobacteriota bacterium]